MSWCPTLDLLAIRMENANMNYKERTRDPGEQVVVCDVDDTLIMYDLSKHPGATTQVIVNPYSKMGIDIVPNKKNINTLIKFKKLGYFVIVWSRTGKLWAEEVVRELGLSEFVDQTLCKPLFYIDDKDAETWIGDRVWRAQEEGYGA